MKRLEPLLALLVGASAVYAVLTINASPLTPGVSSDSVEYLSAAESFAWSGTFVVPVTSWSSPDSVAPLAHFPPGFPALIALPVRLGVHAPAAALWVMAASSGVALAFSFLLAAEAFGTAAGFLGALLLLLTPVFTKLNLAIWSEPSYLALTLVMFWVMLRQPRRALAYGALAAAGVAVRYVGLAGAITAGIWAAQQGGSRRERILDAGAATLPSIVLLGWWWGRVAAAGASVRRLGLHLHLTRNVVQLRALFPDWLVPESWHAGGWAALGLVALGVLLIVGAARDGSWRQRRPVVVLAGIYGAAYLVVVVASRLFLDERIPFDARIFAPLLLLATVAVAGTARVWLPDRHALVRWSVAALAGWWCVAMLRDIQGGVRVVNEEGRFYTFVGWLRSPLVAWLGREASTYAVIYSNEPAMVTYDIGRPAKLLPDAGEDLQAFAAAFRRRPGAVMIAYPLHPGNRPDAEFVDLLSLRPVVRTSMGAIYVPRQGPETPAGDPGGRPTAGSPPE